MQELDRAADQRRPFAHGNDAETAAAVRRSDSFAAIFNLELQHAALIREPDPRVLHARVTRDVAQRFLKDTINLYADFAVDGHGRHRAFVRDGEAELPLDRGKLPVDRP